MNMTRKIFFVIQLAILTLLSGCIKDTYNMKMLSGKAHLSPTLAISAIKGDVSFADAVKPTDTIVFDQNRLVIIVYKQDSLIDLKPADFSKAAITRTATIDPGSFDLNLKGVLNNLSGDFLFSNPVIRFKYINSFPDSVIVNLVTSGRNQNKTANLNLKPFGLTIPALPVTQPLTATFMIDKNNSNLPKLVSLPPEVISYSGTVTLKANAKSGPDVENASIPMRVTGSLEMEIPLDIKINNLQFADTVDNFISKGDSANNTFNPEDIQFLRIIINAKNGFPLGASLKLSLYDSETKTIKNTIDAPDILKAAPVGSDGKVTGVTESSTEIEFTNDFFKVVNSADKIIFRYTLVSSGDGSQSVKIYSDYRINFNAALVIKPDLNLK